MDALRELLADGPRTVASLVAPLAHYIPPEIALRTDHAEIVLKGDVGEKVWHGRLAYIIRMARFSRGFKIEGSGDMATITIVPGSKEFLSIDKPISAPLEDRADIPVRYCRHCGVKMTGLSGKRFVHSRECSEAAADRKQNERKKVLRAAARALREKKVVEGRDS